MSSPSKSDINTHLIETIIQQQPISQNASTHQNRQNHIEINPSSYSCCHLSELRSCIGPDPFKNVQTLIQVRPLGRACVRKDHHFECGACGHAPPRLYACIACAEVFCDTHAPGHASDSSHAIAVDVDRAELFCCICKDQVYDKDFDAEVVLAAVGSVSGPSPLPPQLGENLRKRRRVDFKPWAPDLKERALIVENSIPLASQLGDDPALDAASLPWGLRGLNNLGNTCFMNSVLQALLHTPPFRNYFLSDMHNRYFCQSKNGSSGDNIVITSKNVKKSNAKANANANVNENAEVKTFCLACDLDAMFSAVFAGDRTPYSPAKFLYSWWQHASNFASYEQQDAHEFFISILDGIHEKMQKDQHKPSSQGVWV